MPAATIDGDAIVGELITADQVVAAEDAGATHKELTAVFNLKEKAQEFAAAFSNLLEWESDIVGTELEAEYDSLVDRGFSLRDKVAAVMNTVDAALAWVRGWIPGLDGLGVAWFIPVAVIVALLSALGIWLADYAKFARKFAEQKRIAAELRAEGVSPIEANRQAAAAVAETTPGMFAGVGAPLMLLGVAAGGFFLWRMFRE